MTRLLGCITTRAEDCNVRIPLEWKPRELKLRGIPRKRWIDVFDNVLRNLGVEDSGETW